MPKGLEGLVEPKVLAIFSTFLLNPQKLYHLNSLAQSSKVPVSSTFRIIHKLVKNNFVEEIKVGKVSIYKLADNLKIKAIRELYE